MLSSCRCSRLFQLIALSALLSCENPYGPEKKSTVTFSFRLAENNNSDSRFTFDEGYISLQRFSLITRNERYDFANYEYDVSPETNPFILHSATGDKNISRNIAPGVFRSLEMELLLTEQETSLPFAFTDGSAVWSEISPTSYPIFMKGNFLDGEVRRTILLAIDSITFLNFEGEMESFGASTDETILLDDNNFITLTLTPQRWFSPITTDMILSAQSVRRDKEEVVFIHRTFNASLFHMIVHNLTVSGQLRVKSTPG
jgi:hypothetical protein